MIEYNNKKYIFFIIFFCLSISNLILAEKAEYDKSKNLAKTLGQTNIITSEKFRVVGKNIFYDKKNTIVKLTI